MFALKLSTGTVIIDGPEKLMVVKTTVSEYNKNHDEEGKFASAPSGPWTATGTKAEAVAFSKDSKIKGDVYHGTLEKNAEKIKKEGFKRDARSTGAKTNFPGVIMLTSSKEDAAWYGRRNTLSEGRVLKMRVNADKVKRFSDDGFNQYTKKIAVEHGITLYSKRGELVGSDSDFRKATQIASDTLMKKYNAVVIKGYKVNTIMIKDPKTIMVYDDVKA